MRILAIFYPFVLSLSKHERVARTGAESMSFWVYMLRCADGSYYTGHTDDMERRLSEHDLGQPACYTGTRRPVRLVFCEDVPSREEALAMERRIKGWRREKKEALISRDWERISRLARSKGRDGG